MSHAAHSADAVPGGAAAAVRADDKPTANAATSAGPAPRALAGPPRGRLPDGRYNPGFVQYRVRSRGVAVRVPDPGGGPAWAVETFAADVLKLDRPARTLRNARVVSRRRCAQLGRWSNGRFGWVFPGGRFRPVSVEDRLLLCTPRRRPAAQAAFHTVLNVDTPSEPRVTATVAWGLVPGATAVHVDGSGAADGDAQAGAGGVFLRVGGATATATDATATATTPHGIVTLRLGPRRRGRADELLADMQARRENQLRLSLGLAPRPPAPRLVPGSERVEARAPDPAGGPGHGLLVARTEDGDPCIGGAGGQAVGDRLGEVEMRLGLFWPSAVDQAACRSGPPPTRARPCDVSTGFGNAEELEADNAFLRQARTERRLLPGRTTVTVRCHPDVTEVTLHTPRDIRTLVPSPMAHAVLAVYDGGFPAGDLELAARLRSGRSWTVRVPLGS